MRLHTRQHYRRMAYKTLKLTGQWILIDIRFTNAFPPRLGITATKRYGSACQRNRFKRIVREAFRTAFPFLNLAFDVVVRPRSQAVRAKMQDVQQEFLSLINQAAKSDFAS